MRTSSAINAQIPLRHHILLRLSSALGELLMPLIRLCCGLLSILQLVEDQFDRILDFRN